MRWRGVPLGMHRPNPQYLDVDLSLPADILLKEEPEDEEEEDEEDEEEDDIGCNPYPPFFRIRSESSGHAILILPEIRKFLIEMTPLFPQVHGGRCSTAKGLATTLPASQLGPA